MIELLDRLFLGVAPRASTRAGGIAVRAQLGAQIRAAGRLPVAACAIRAQRHRSSNRRNALHDLIIGGDSPRRELLTAKQRVEVADVSRLLRAGVPGGDPVLTREIENRLAMAVSAHRRAFAREARLALIIIVYH